jgi:hypothetical protein
MEDLVISQDIEKSLKEIKAHSSKLFDKRTKQIEQFQQK